MCLSFTSIPYRQSSKHVARKSSMPRLNTDRATRKRAEKLDAAKRRVSENLRPLRSRRRRRRSESADRLSPDEKRLCEGVATFRGRELARALYDRCVRPILPRRARAPERESNAESDAESDAELEFEYARALNLAAEMNFKDEDEQEVAASASCSLIDLRTAGFLNPLLQGSLHLRVSNYQVQSTCVHLYS